jgi:hypothetical protein
MSTKILSEGGDAGGGFLVNPDTAAHQAATSPICKEPTPTLAQLEAGNFKKGHVKIAGLDIAIEYPQGATRSGTKPDGTAWSQTLQSHYGYVKRSSGADDEAVDVFIKPGTQSDYSGPVFIVNQQDADGDFDEHKIMLGWSDEASAQQAYLANYEQGWDRIDSIVTASLEQFKAWLKEGDLSQPAQMVIGSAASKTAWLAIKFVPVGIGGFRQEIQGLFSSESKARAACKTRLTLIGPVRADEVLPEESAPWPGAYYPLED